MKNTAQYPQSDLTFLANFDRPIAFQRVFVTITGSVTAALMLSQLVYWTLHGKHENGWIFKTRKQWFDEIGLSRKEQETARKVLKNKSLMDELLKDIPATLYYKVNVENLRKLLGFNGLHECNQMARKSPTRWPQSSQQDGPKVANKMATLSPPFNKKDYIETTSTKAKTARARNENPAIRAAGLGRAIAIELGYAPGPVMQAIESSVEEELRAGRPEKVIHDDLYQAGLRWKAIRRLIREMPDTEFFRRSWRDITLLEEMAARREAANEQQPALKPLEPTTPRRHHRPHHPLRQPTNYPTSYPKQPDNPPITFDDHPEVKKIYERLVSGDKLSDAESSLLIRTYDEETRKQNGRV